MSIQRFRLAIVSLALAVTTLICGQAWAIYYALAPSKDAWGLKYDVAVEEAGPDTVTVKFTLADEGRLKPIHSVSLAVLDKQYSGQNSQRYDVKGKFELKSTGDGKRVGQMQIRKDQASQAIVRVLTQRVDGKFQSAGAAYYDIPLSKHLKQGGAFGLATPQTTPPVKK
jgi:hypothetical protein